MRVQHFSVDQEKVKDAVRSENTEDTFDCTSLAFKNNWKKLKSLLKPLTGSQTNAKIS